MGLGGNLIWTAVLAAIAERDGDAPVVCAVPGLSDLLVGRLYDRAVDLRDDPIFRGNPDLAFVSAAPKGAVARIADRAFFAVVAPAPLRRAYETAVFRAAERRRRRGGAHYVHVDMRRHSYASHQTRRRTYWKPGRAHDAIARPFGVERVAHPPRLYIAAEERAAVARLLRDRGIDGPFVAVEPDTNRDWFGDLRGWPRERWQTVVDALGAHKPDVPVVQIGLGRSGVLDGVVDLTGRTDFRQASEIVRRSALFVGTEGGLMHAARAVDARALILWGGVTLPEFIGYPDTQTTLCKYVDCAPCGNAGWCDFSHKCMCGIAEDEVISAALALLDAPTAAQPTREDLERRP